MEQREPQLAHTEKESTLNPGFSKGSPWTVEVDVYLLKDGDCPEFKVESFLQDKDDGDLIFNNRGRPGFNVVFNLHDVTNSNYRFPGPPNLKQAVWSQLGTNCPKTEKWDVFDPVRVLDNGARLVVRNVNVKPVLGAFQYALRVTKDGEDYLALDPGGLNQNGNTTFVNS